MNYGTVKWYNTSKGYGFISNSDGSGDVFVHSSSVQGGEFSTLQDAQKVTFDIEPDPKNHKKLRAVNVHIV